MKRILLMFILSFFSYVSQAQQFKVATYNMSSSMVDIASLGAMGWDVAGLQEVDPDFEIGEDYGIVRHADNVSKRDVVIAYRKDMFTLENSGGFYLSRKTGERPCAWAHLRHLSSGKDFYFLSSRISHPVTKEDGSLNYSRNKADMQRLREMTSGLIPEDTPSICVGDFNTGHKAKHWGVFANSRWFDVYRHLQLAGTLSAHMKQLGGDAGLPYHICLDGFRPLRLESSANKAPMAAYVAFNPQTDPSIYDTPSPVNDKTVRVVSSNIRFMNNATDLENGWNRRRSAIIYMMNDIKPSVIGFQECCREQRQYVLDRCSDYDYVEYQVRQNEPDLKSYAAFTDPVMWDRNVLELLEWDAFYLSETPDTCSMSWDAAEPRTALWCRFKHKQTGKEFIFINTHLDHKGVEARKNGLEVLLNQMEKVNVKKLPMVVLGDFNAQYKEATLDRIKKEWKDARFAAKDSDDKYTFNGFGKSWNGTVDYIWCKGFKKCHDFKVIVRKYNHVPFISDHYPIRADLEL